MLIALTVDGHNFGNFVLPASFDDGYSLAFFFDEDHYHAHQIVDDSFVAVVDGLVVDDVAFPLMEQSESHF